MVGYMFRENMLVFFSFILNNSWSFFISNTGIYTAIMIVKLIKSKVLKLWYRRSAISDAKELGHKFPMT